MELILQNHSSYPRIDEQPGQPRLRRAHAAGERGAIDSEELVAIERAQIDAVIHEQEEAGVDVVTDGQVGWHDPVSHVMGRLDGVRLDGPLRYLDTNAYFRQPVVTGRLRRRAPIVVDDFALARIAAERRVKPVLPGPYTLARLSVLESGPYDGVPALAHALSEVLAAEVSELAQAGAEFIQIEEPAILSHPADIRLFRQLLEPLWAARNRAQLMVATYFGDAAPLYAQLNSVPADVLVLDFTYSATLLDVIRATGASAALGLGVVDGRNTRMESAALVARQVEDALRRYALDTVHLLPSCGLGHLPRDSARAKLALLAEIKGMVHGVQGGDG